MSCTIRTQVTTDPSGTTRSLKLIMSNRPYRNTSQYPSPGGSSRIPRTRSITDQGGAASTKIISMCVRAGSKRPLTGERIMSGCTHTHTEAANRRTGAWRNSSAVGTAVGDDVRLMPIRCVSTHTHAHLQIMWSEIPLDGVPDAFQIIPRYGFPPFWPFC